MSAITSNALLFWQRYRILICLVVAGEAIFSLPFHITRFFRPTLLSVFELSNTDLGDAFAIYGLTAMLAYFPGGLLADRFSARKLLALSLLFTAVGGIFMVQVPSHIGLALLYGYWGVTTIFLFWAAMIRAAREWGTQTTQGSAFGILDGGRGLVAAVLATLAVTVFTFVAPGESAGHIDADRAHALQVVIVFYSVLTFLAAIFVWCVIPETGVCAKASRSPRTGAIHLLKNKSIWLQAIVVICAYCAYKGLDNFSLYAVDAMGFDEVEAARYSAYAAYLRVFAAVSAGFLANRFLASNVILISFIVMVVSYTTLFLIVPDQSNILWLYGNIIVTYSAVFALRGVYFALLHEAGTPAKDTGTAVGIVSFVGFSPDMFFAPIAGRILDASPGVTGHQHFFLLLIIIAVIGCLATYILARRSRSL